MVDQPGLDQPGGAGCTSTRHADGSAEEVPALLRAMGSGDRDRRLTALSALRSRVYRRGSICRCTIATLPFLFAMATDAAHPDRGEIVRLLTDIGQSAVDRVEDDHVGDDADPDDDPEPSEYSDHVAAARVVTERGDLFLGFAVDGDPAVRRAAITGLAYFVDDAERAAALIRERLPAEPGTGERVLLVSTMAALADRRPHVATDARTWLVGLATDPAQDPETRMAALIQTAGLATDRIGDDLVPAVISLLRTAERTGRPLSQLPALLRTVNRMFGERVAPRTTLLAAQLRSPDPDIVVDAMKMGVEMMTRWRGDHSGLIAHIAGLLRSADSRIAAEAATALRTCHPIAGHAREALAAVVASRGPAAWAAADPGVRRAHQEAVAALARLGDRRALPSLLLAFDDRFEDRRAVMDVQALTAAAPDLVPRLCGLLRRQKALTMTNETTAKYVLDALAAMAPGQSEQMVAEALDAIADFLGATSERYLPSLTAAVLDAFGEFGPAAAAMLPTIRELTGSTHPFVRPAAVRALWLVRRDPDEVVPMLTGVVDHEASHVVRVAAGTLAMIGPPAAAALPHLRARLSDDYEWVRVPCATAIWDIAGGAEAATVLDVLLTAWVDHPAVAYDVVACLDRMGPAAAPAVPFLRDRLAGSWRNGDHPDIGRDEDLQRTGRAIIVRVMSEQTQFLVEDVFDLPGRGGLLVTGQVLAGRIAAGETLRDAVTGAGAQVLGVELRVPANRPGNTVTLVVARTDPTPVAVGRVLTTSR